MTRMIALAAAVFAAAPAFADSSAFLAEHAAENGEYQTVRFVESGGFDGDFTTFSSKSAPSVSALEVALRAAEENDDRQLARYLRAELGL